MKKILQHIKDSQLKILYLDLRNGKRKKPTFIEYKKYLEKSRLKISITEKEFFQLCLNNMEISRTELVLYKINYHRVELFLVFCLCVAQLLTEYQIIKGF